VCVCVCVCVCEWVRIVYWLLQDTDAEHSTAAAILLYSV